MRLAVRREPFDDPDWLYELKYDGFRALLITDDGAVRLVSRNAHVYKGFPRLVEELGRELASFGHTVLDGEIVCLDANGCPQFGAIWRASLRSGAAAPTFSGDVTSWIKIKNPDYSQAIEQWERFERKPQSRAYAALALSRQAP